MRSITRRAPLALAVLALAMPLGAPAASAAPALGDRGAGEIRVTELGSPESPFHPLILNQRGQILGVTLPSLTVSLYDRGRITQTSPAPPDARYQPHAHALNDRGDVAGTLVRASFPFPPEPADARPYLWSQGRHVDLGFSEGWVTHDLNERRQILLAAYPFGTSPDRVWDEGGVVSAPVPEGLGASFVALNDEGVAVGTLSGPEGSEAAIWRVGGDITGLGSLGGGSRGQWISEAGTVFGHSSTAGGFQQAFAWRNGRMRALTLGGDSSTIHQVSATGVAAGVSQTATGELHGFLWRGGQTIDLGPSVDFEPAAANIWGQVVGCTHDPSTGRHTMWLRQGDRRVDLTGLVGMNLSAPCDNAHINDRGQIVNSVSDLGTGQSRGVMWTVPPLWGVG